TKAFTAVACADQPSSEKVTVRQVPTSISTHQKVFPNDSATLTSSVSGGSLPSGGTVTFRLFGPTDGGATPHTALENCQAGGDPAVGTGGLLYKQIRTTFGGTSETLSTSNATVSVDTSDTFYWRVTYNPNASAF